MKKAIAYFRVSTERQGRSGLGLEAQQLSVHNFVASNGFDLIGEYTEVESGKKNNRPVLLEALAYCKKLKATLVIAKLDRLGRNVAFTSTLMESNVAFVACDNPEATPLILHILVAFAEHEGKQISIRTKDALNAAKLRGVQLGQFGKTVLSKRNKKAAKEFATSMKSIIKLLNEEGFKTVRSITYELNRRSVPTFRKGTNKWHSTSVHALIQRLNTL